MGKKKIAQCLRCKVLLRPENRDDQKPICQFCDRETASSLDRSIADWIKRQCPRGGCE